MTLKQAIKLSKEINKARIDFYTTKGIYEELNNDFIAQQFDYTSPIYRKIMKIKGMQKETEFGFLTVFSKPREVGEGISLKITTIQSITKPSESVKIKYHYNNKVKVSIKVSRLVGYKDFTKTITSIKDVVNKYLDKKLGARK